MTLLGHSFVGDEAQARREGCRVYLHGILGNRANWRGIARKVTKARGEPALLVDLREHGDSLGMEGADTLAQAARDVLDLGEALRAPIREVVGHSFGGKVALEIVRQAEGEVHACWVVDASPGRRAQKTASNSVEKVLTTLEGAPADFEDREAFVGYLEERGLSAGIGQWLAMNLRRSESGRRAFGPDLSRIRALLASYAEEDLFPLIEDPPCPLTFVLGERSDAVPAEDRRRLLELSRQVEDVTVEIVPDAGHWVHVDAPAATERLLGGDVD